jgi:hypothetical protein
MSIERHIIRLQVRIETVAENESVPGPAGLTLEDTLAALTTKGRRRVVMLLERIQIFSEDPEERAAADYIRKIADRAWSGSPSRPARG